MALTEVVLPPVTRVQIARYAGAIGDFNPMHVDEEFARAAGMPSVIAHGPLSAALVLDAVVGQLGVDALRSAEVRLRAAVFPGDVLTVRPGPDGVEAVKADGTLALTVTLRTAQS
jgi:acyl dehydratase